MDILDSNSVKSGLNVSGQLKYHLAKQAYWAKFLGIIGIILSILGAIIMLSTILGMSFLASNPAADSPFGEMGGMLTMIYGFSIIMMLPMIYLSWLCYNHGKKIQIAFRTNNQYAFENGMESFAKLFKFYGILMLVSIAFYIIFIIYFMATFKIPL